MRVLLPILLHLSANPDNNPIREACDNKGEIQPEVCMFCHYTIPDFKAEWLLWAIALEYTPTAMTLR